jgi:hypothetical protein
LVRRAGEDARLATKAHRRSGKEAGRGNGGRDRSKSGESGGMGKTGCKISVYIGIQTHRKLDNDTLNMYYG